MDEETRNKLAAALANGDLAALLSAVLEASGSFKITAEHVEELVRRYSDQKFDGWANAGLSIRIGNMGAHATHALQVFPLIPMSQGKASLPHEAPRG